MEQENHGRRPRRRVLWNEGRVYTPFLAQLRSIPRRVSPLRAREFFQCHLEKVPELNITDGKTAMINQIRN